MSGKNKQQASASGQPTLELPSLPGIESQPTIEIEPIVEAEPVEQPTTRRTLEDLKLEVFIVEVPFIIEGTDGYQDDERNRRCDLGNLSREHARKLRAIRRGYDQSTGKDVKSLADAVRTWLDTVDI